jgi:hypothetical protein
MFLAAQSLVDEQIAGAGQRHARMRRDECVDPDEHPRLKKT